MTSTPPPPPPAPARETVVDERVVALRGMFPDYDDLILQSVLDSAGGNQDRAIDTLLGMTDPDFRSEAQPQQPVPQAPALSQTELDEQFARQLVFQEQQQETQNWLQQQQQGRPPAVRRSSRPTAAAAGASASSPQQQPPSEFQEQFNKIAESGKKTFGNIFSKVKAKLQELETGRPAGQQPTMQQQQQQQQYQTYQPHSQPQPSSQTWTPPPAHQAAYFDPNSTPDRTASPPAVTSSPPAVQGYDVSSPAPPSSSPPSSQQLQPQPQPQVPPPPSTSQGTPIDAGKLGLMPKRPVSLIRDPNAPSSASATPTAQQQRSLLDDDDDDGLEYAENPFEDTHAQSNSAKK